MACLISGIGFIRKRFKIFNFQFLIFNLLLTGFEIEIEVKVSFMSNSTQASKGIWDWDVVKLAVGLPMLLYAAFFFFIGFNEEGTRAAIAWSAKISFTLFCLAFAASAAHLRIRNSLSFWWLINRKYLGIAFAVNHLIHLGFLVLLQQVFHPVFDVAASTSLMAGGLAYLFVVLMLLTSFETFSKQLSQKNWKLLHTIGGYWIWVIFLSTYFKKVMNVGVAFLPFVLILILVLLLRIFKKK